jgi:putative hemin transport protein
MSEALLAAPATRLRQAYVELSRDQPQLRMREAAQVLGVSEAQLVATEVGRTAVRLRDDWRSLLQGMPALGPTMCLTRNEACVHERHGRFEHVEVNGGMGLVLGPDIDLRLFLRRWAFGFACTQMLHSGARTSLQFFDAQGQAIHKIYLTDQSDAGAYERLVRAIAHRDQEPELTTQVPACAPEPRPDTAIDVAGLRAGWSALRDTHDFATLLNSFKAGREQALRLVGAPLAVAVDGDAAWRALQAVSASGEEIMVFVGNCGCIQIHSGAAQRVARTGPWLNILDQNFNLHLREDLVASSWIVRKPTVDGMVHSLELFDSTGQLVAQFFGRRKPGQPERNGWRDILAGIEAAAPALRKPQRNS